MNPGRETVIHCPIGLYDRYEGEIARLTEALNQASEVPTKVHAAHDLREAVAFLLACSAYNKDDLNCRLCRRVAALREKTASLVENVGALAH